MENASNSPTPPSRDHFICPITLDVCRDPVLAEDGHVYERVAIVKWIEEQGTSPLTRQSLDVNDLCSIGNTKQSDQTNPKVDSTPTNMMTLPSAPKADEEQPIVCKKICSVKGVLLFIMLAIGLIVVCFVSATTIIIYLRRSTGTYSMYATPAEYPNNLTNPSITIKSPNNCTLSHIAPLFLWNNVKSFNYRYYSTLYKTSSNRTVITFAFRNDPSYWCLDDVSVIDISSNIELVTNGGFEDNPSDGFTRCNSYGNSSTTLFIASAYPYNGQRSFCDGSTGLPDYLSQTLNTKTGQTYRVSFWLQNKGNSPNSAQVLMSD